VGKIPVDMYDLHIQIRKELAAQAKGAAERSDLGLSTWVRMAIREKLEREAR
jgi:hypothetical protein